MNEKKYPSSKWTEEEETLVIKMFHEGKSYEEIAKMINENKKQESSDTYVIRRSPRAVVFQARKFGLITNEELLEQDKQNTLEKQRARKKNLCQIKKIVLKRDKNKCVYCNSTNNLQFAHIISFDSSRENLEEEAITLCKEHHDTFDGRKKSIIDGRIQITKVVYDRMCSYYPNYSESYEFYNEYCESCQDFHFGIRKSVEKEEEQFESVIREQVEKIWKN